MWRWWEEEKRDDGVKWTYLQHKGPVFAPAYEPLPHDIKFYYDGKLPAYKYKSSGTPRDGVFETVKMTSLVETWLKKTKNTRNCAAVISTCFSLFKAEFHRNEICLWWVPLYERTLQSIF